MKMWVICVELALKEMSSLLRKAKTELECMCLALECCCCMTCKVEVILMALRFHSDLWHSVTLKQLNYEHSKYLIL